MRDLFIWGSQGDDVLPARQHEHIANPHRVRRLAIDFHALRMALDPMLTGPDIMRAAALAGLVGGGLASFAVLALALGIADWRDLLGRLRRQPA